MDIYSFINSTAIADYCREIGHRFTPVESAYLIYASEKHTVSEKHDAWKALIAETEDMELKERPWTPHFDSLHCFLKQYMQIENKYLHLFYRDEPQCVYSFQYLHNEDCQYTVDEHLFADFKSCYENMKAEIEDPAEITDFCISKQWISSADEEHIRKITLCITYDNCPTMLWEVRGYMDETEGTVLNAFDGLWLEVPTPFQKGDILIEESKYCLDREPFVLYSIPYWAEDDKSEQLIQHHRKNGDTTDMCASICTLDFDGTLCPGCGPNYLHMNYYKGELIGSEEILSVISQYLIGKTDIDAYQRACDILNSKNLEQF